MFVLASVNCQQPSTVPGLIQSAAVNGPLNVLRVRQPTVIERSTPIRRAPISSPISSNLLDEETRDNYVSFFFLLLSPSSYFARSHFTEHEITIYLFNDLSLSFSFSKLINVLCHILDGNCYLKWHFPIPAEWPVQFRIWCPRWLWKSPVSKGRGWWSWNS